MLSTCWGKKKEATKASEPITAPKLFSILDSVDPDSHSCLSSPCCRKCKRAGHGTAEPLGRKWSHRPRWFPGRSYSYPSQERREERKEAQTFLWTNHVSSHPPVYIHRSKRSKRGPPKACGTMKANFSFYSINIVKASQTRTSLGVVMKLSVSCLTSKHLSPLLQGKNFNKWICFLGIDPSHSDKSIGF